ncbi:MAG: hypothetical protein Hyperionvirus5_91 [Hyperionvirus sp.]|uniref:Uncharacterized protein n=1 Tax=Hyperionvirus sp. TaxID=2487770 RepID=A0A3G5A7S6_9VIRU|nr:MAG: hypothetical protein Hyperionvirus5_91 [Hyperionvirus sp.]
MTKYFEKYNKYKSKYLKLKLKRNDPEIKWQDIPKLIAVLDSAISIKFPMKNNTVTYFDIFNYKNGDHYALISPSKELKGNDIDEFIKANIQSNENNFALFPLKKFGSDLELLVVKFTSEGDLWEYIQNFASFLGVANPESATIIKFVKPDENPVIKQMMAELPSYFKQLNRELSI